MKITDSINRGFNLIGIAMVGLAGFAFTPEIFLEKDWDDKGDDILLLVLGVIGIIWYLTGANRYKRSIAPVMLIILSLITKIIAIVIEHKDADAVGDDFGALVLFVLSSIFIIYQYVKTKRLLQESQTQPLT